jgi:DNA-binding MarR family transcriptional regulator
MRHMAIRLPCYCATLRQAARVISQKYDAALRGMHLTITQFTLLTALAEMSRPSVNDLAESLAMDQTTLSRTLRLMAREGLICAVAGEDKRESRWILTARGRERRRRAHPRWEAAQKELEKTLGTAETQRLGAAAFALASRLSV